MDPNEPFCLGSVPVVLSPAGTHCRPLSDPTLSRVTINLQHPSPVNLLMGSSSNNRSGDRPMGSKSFITWWTKLWLRISALRNFINEHHGVNTS